jgi:glutathione S-transferase
MPSVIRFEEGADALTRLHPFGRVPVLEAGLFRQREMQAILDCLDAGAAQPRTVPEVPEGLARMRQVMGISDSCAHWPMLRGGAWDLARCHLWPMPDNFGMVPGGEEMIAARPALSDWCGWMETCPAAQATRPELTKEAMA